MALTMSWWWWICLVTLLKGVTALPDDNTEERPLAVLAAGPAGPELAELTRATLERAGLRAHVVPPPAECTIGSGYGCLNATLRVLVGGGAQVALVATDTSGPPALLLRDAGLEVVGEILPAARLLCYATGGMARSLLDLAIDDVCTAYELVSVTRNVCGVRADCTGGTVTEATCDSTQNNSAALLTDSDDDAVRLARAACEWALPVHVAVLGHRLPFVLAERGIRRPSIYCTRDPTAPSLANLKNGNRLLGPLPCLKDDCPFEPRRVLKLVNVRELAHSPTAYRLVGRLRLDIVESRELSGRVREFGLVRAAQEFLDARPSWARPPAEVRVAVMVPVGTRRHVFSANALRAAAELAERDLNTQNPIVRFKAELVADGCSAAPAFKYVTDALGSEYGALSAILGPACSGPFADIARQSNSLALPVLAYTNQVAPVGPAGRHILLAAGDAREQTNVFAALLSHFGWRRLAVLSEFSTRPAFEASRLRADIVVHVELSNEGEELDTASITEWVERAVQANARILMVNVEDARIVRAALCAGGRAGLHPSAGTVWLLPGLLPLGWLNAKLTNCELHELQEFADGHLSVAPDWYLDWGSNNVSLSWMMRWHQSCIRLTTARALGDCERAPANAALLYDALVLWAAALRRQLTVRPADLDDLHRPSVIEKLVGDVMTTPFDGLTGPFRWTSTAGTHARTVTLMLLQWEANTGTTRFVGRWDADRLSLLNGGPEWRTADKSTPNDGSERCVLGPLAELLHISCSGAFATVAALVLVLAVCALTGGVLVCRRRAEREFRARLAELGMRSLSLKLGGPDRWEIARERVVINRKLGTGAFGTVYGGHALLENGRGWSAVAVKTLKPGASMDEKLDFLSEAEAMKRFDHENIVRLLGVITATEPVCTVMEFVLFGDLKTYLLARRHLAGGSSEEVSPARLTSLALGAARAVSYLAQLRYVHRDVAARNCLVSASRVLKLADFGMTRLVFENDYYRFSRKGLLPVRWMAPESLALGVFSPASDVWSFGVLLYEMVTFGALPHQGLSNAEVLARVKAGRSLDLPTGIKPQLEGLMKSCWAREPRSRPAAADVAALLADSPRLLAPCPDLPLAALPPDTDPVFAEGRWASWAAPASAGTDTTYLSAEAPIGIQEPRDTDAFLP